MSAFAFFTSCGTGANRQPFRREPLQAKNESVLYVYRDASLPSSVKAVVFFDGKSVGILNPDGYYPIHSLAGKHTLRGCGGNLLMTLCKDIDIDLKSGDQLTVSLRYENNQPGYRISSDMADLSSLNNEGNYYDASLREALPQKPGKVALTPAALGASRRDIASPVKVAILNFADETKTDLYGWLAVSLPDAIDQSLRKDFDYARPNPVATQKTAERVATLPLKQQASELKTDLIISGRYILLPGGDRVRIEARIYYRDTDKVLGTESVDSPVTAELFNATKILSDRLVAKFHAMAKK